MIPLALSTLLYQDFRVDFEVIFFMQDLMSVSFLVSHFLVYYFVFSFVMNIGVLNIGHNRFPIELDNQHAHYLRNIIQNQDYVDRFHCHGHYIALLLFHEQSYTVVRSFFDTPLNTQPQYYYGPVYGTLHPYIITVFLFNHLLTLNFLYLHETLFQHVLLSF